MKFQVLFRPQNVITHAPEATTLFNAANWAGLPIDSTCGGRGTCGKCKVQLLSGDVETSTADRRQLLPDEVEGGWRLSCQAHVYGDVECRVPQLLRVPKAATMGLGRLVVLDPNVRKVHLELAEPDLGDQ